MFIMVSSSRFSQASRMDGGSSDDDQLDDYTDQFSHNYMLEPASCSVAESEENKVLRW